MSDRSPKRNGCLFEMERNGGPFCRSEEDRPRTVPEYVPSERSRTGNIGIRYSCAFDFRQNQVAETGAKYNARDPGSPVTRARPCEKTLLPMSCGGGFQAVPGSACIGICLPIGEYVQPCGIGFTAAAFHIGFGFPVFDNRKIQEDAVDAVVICGVIAGSQGSNFPRWSRKCRAGPPNHQ